MRSLLFFFFFLSLEAWDKLSIMPLNMYSYHQSAHPSIHQMQIRNSRNQTTYFNSGPSYTGRVSHPLEMTMVRGTRLVRQAERRRRIRRLVKGRDVLGTEIEVGEMLARILEAFVEEIGCGAGCG